MASRRFSDHSLRAQLPKLLKKVRETPVRWSEEDVETTACQVSDHVPSTVMIADNNNRCCWLQIVIMLLLLLLLLLLCECERSVLTATQLPRRSLSAPAARCYSAVRVLGESITTEGRRLQETFCPKTSAQGFLGYAVSACATCCFQAFHHS